MHSVLIVDDEPFVRLSLASMRAWEEDGFTLSYEASNGKEALEVLAAHPEIDIVLLDISMPVMDGIEFLKHRGGKTPAVVVLSAYDNFHLVRTAFTLGALDYVRKEEMEGDSLLAVLKKTAAGIEKTQEADASVIERQQVDFLRAQMLRDLLAEPMTGDSAAALASLGVSLAPPFAICAFWVGDFDDVSARYRDEGIERFAAMMERSLAQVLAKRGSGYVVTVRAGPRCGALPGHRGSGGILLHGRKGVPGALPFHPHYVLTERPLQRTRRHPGRLPDGPLAPHRGIPHCRALQEAHTGKVRGPRSLPG